MSDHGHHAPSHAPKASSNKGGGGGDILVEGAFGGILGAFMGLVCMGVQVILWSKH